HQIIGSLLPVVLLTALLFAVIGGLYVLFHGPIWYQLNSNQNNWKHYSKEFSTFVAYLLPIWIVYFFVEMMIDLRYEVIIQLGGAASQVVLWIPSVIMGLALLVIIPSHSVLSLKKGWALWKKQPGALFVTLLLPFLSIMAASTLVDLVWTQSPELGFLLGVPAISVLTWARKFIILEVSDVL
ncbi:hypothetical protein HN451_11390, partial [archaeon]|nr:hypothetical protein [archaeon]